MNTQSPFAIAAERLQARYYRRFPQAHWSKWDQTSIKDRWYRRGTCHIVRQSLGATMHLVTISHKTHNLMLAAQAKRGRALDTSDIEEDESGVTFPVSDTTFQRLSDLATQVGVTLEEALVLLLEKEMNHTN